MVPDSFENPIKASENHCPGCGSNDICVFYRVANAPVHNTALMLNREDALKSPRRNISLGFCKACGFISNLEYDADMMDHSYPYEDQQGFSPAFQAYSEHLTHYLIEKYDIYQKKVVEIGCGKGDFLVQLCETGRNKGVGIDPLCPDKNIEADEDDVEFLKENYSEKHGNLNADLIACRHTLEHIFFTAQFLQLLRKSLNGHTNPIIFFEVPDVKRILDENAFWDIYYEHCSYFSVESLARLFRNCGFEILEISRSFNDQYLWIESSPALIPSKNIIGPEESVEDLFQQVKSFKMKTDEKFRNWEKIIREKCKSGEKIAIWGSGSKCVSFLSTLNAEDKIQCVIDINPLRQGKYLPASGIEIRGPEFLKASKTNLVIVMNPVYHQEIQKMLRDMNVKTDIMSV